MNNIKETHTHKLRWKENGKEIKSAKQRRTSNEKKALCKKNEAFEIQYIPLNPLEMVFYDSLY